MFEQADDDAAALGLPTCVAPLWAGNYTCIDMMSEYAWTILLRTCKVA